MTLLHRVRREADGSALITAIVILSIMLMMGIPLLDMIDSTQRRTTTERVGDTAYNVAEASMTAETLALTASWPYLAAQALPASCNRTATSTRCPQGVVLAKDFAGSDFDVNSNWGIEVRDNSGAAATYYNRAQLTATSCGAVIPCTWDSNGDGIMWVRARGTIRGRSRALVAQVRQQISRIPIPRAVVTAGSLTTTNNGRKTIVDGKGCLAKTKPSGACNNVQPAPVVVRCTTTTPAVPEDLCLGYRSEQVAPNLYTQDVASPNLLTAAQLIQVRAYAMAAGTYRTTCPSTAAEMTGAVVFVEPASSISAALSCSVASIGVANSAAAPGVLIVNRGTLSIGSNFDFYGIVYLANNLPAPSDAGKLLTLTGNAYIQGGVFVDGRGGVSAGSSGLNISFDENAFGSLKGISGNASIVQSTFRELPSGL